VNGPCDAVGYQAAQVDSKAPHLQLGSTRRWLVGRGSTLTVAGTAVPQQTRLDVEALLYGIPVHLFSDRGKSTTGFSTGWAASDVATYTRVLGVRARTDGCSGSVTLVVDESPLQALAGVVGLALTVIGGVGVALVAFRRRRPGVTSALGAALLGLVLGLLGGLGAGLFLQQVEALSPLDRSTLIAPLAGAVVGLAAGAAGGFRQPAEGRIAGAWFVRLPIALAAGLVAALLATLLPPALHVGALSGSDVITPARALEIARMNGALYNRAALQMDAGQIASLDSGPLGTATVHDFEARSNAGLAGYQPVPIEKLRVYVPHQHAFPAIFAARLTTRVSNFDGSVGADPVEQVLVFAAHDERSPWTVVAAPFVVRGLSLPEFSLRADGFSELSSPGDRVAIKPERLAGAYAAAFDQAVAGTAVAAPFTADPFIDAYAKSVRDGVSRFAGNGLTYRLSLQAAPGTWAFRARDGSAIVVGSTVQDAEWRGGSKNCPLQNAGRTNYGPSVSPGLYRAIGQHSVSQLLALDSARSVHVVGSFDGELTSSVQTDQACPGR
jgi:hypothetical protein